jgi:hypothetical protein
VLSRAILSPPPLDRPQHRPAHTVTTASRGAAQAEPSGRHRDRALGAAAARGHGGMSKLVAKSEPTS